MYSGAMACIAFLVSLVSDNIFTVLLSPLMINIILSIIVPIKKQKYLYDSILNPVNGGLLLDEGLIVYSLLAVALLGIIVVVQRNKEFF